MNGLADPALTRALMAGVWMTDPVLFADAFGCPASVATMALNTPTRLLRAITTLGPGRVRWARLEERPRRERGAVSAMPVWLLDGAPSDHDAICAAADVDADAR